MRAKELIALIVAIMLIVALFVYLKRADIYRFLYTEVYLREVDLPVDLPAPEAPEA